jgi:predicted P-loop ATPase
MKQYYHISLINKRAEQNPGLSRECVELINLQKNPGIILESPWSPVIAFNNYLKEDNFRACSFLVFDIDNDPASEQLRLDDAKDSFKDYWHILATTKNHQVEKVTKAGKVKPAADRYRLILAFDKTIENLEQYKNLWNFYAVAFNLTKVADPLKDGARFYYASKEITSINQEGKLLATDIEIENRLKPGPKLALNKKEIDQLKEVGIKGALSKRTLSFLAQQPSHEPWHHRFYTAALDLKSQGYDESEAAEELAKASPEGALDDTDFKQIQDVYKNDRGEVSEKRSPWPELVTKELKNGDIIQYPEKNSALNCNYLIENVMKLQLRLNTRMNLIEKNSKGDFITDRDINQIVSQANSYKLGLTKDLIYAQIDVLGQARKYDPLTSGIEKKTWDGKSRFGELLETLNFPDDVTEVDKKLYERFLRRWLIGVVTKIYHPGSENNMIVFVGQQGAGKSRWFRRLAEVYPDGFIESHINTEDKDSHLNLLKYFIWSVSELDTVTWSRDVGALKDFITKSEVRVRPAYAKFEERGRSIASFCASVNSRDFLYDTTGNRRYLIMLVEGANANHTVDIGQVFAEAKVLMESGERAWFDKNEIDEVNKYNERFMSRSDILETFELRVSEGEQCLTLSEIAAQLGLNEFKASDRRSIRDWMTKKKIKEVNHSNVKKYYVEISPSLQLGATRPTSATKIVGGINRIDMLRGPSKKDGLKQ